MDIYRENILENWRNPKNFGRLAGADVSFEAANSVCGDKIGMEIKIKKKQSGRATAGEENQIEAIKFWGEGCAISQASASLLTEHVKGKSLEEIKKMGQEEILKLLGIELSPARLKCALLPLEVLQKAVTFKKK